MHSWALGRVRLHARSVLGGRQDQCRRDFNLRRWAKLARPRPEVHTGLRSCTLEPLDVINCTPTPYSVAGVANTPASGICGTGGPSLLHHRPMSTAVSVARYTAARVLARCTLEGFDAIDGTLSPCPVASVTNAHASDVCGIGTGSPGHRPMCTANSAEGTAEKTLATTSTSSWTEPAMLRPQSSEGRSGAQCSCVFTSV